MTATSTQPKFTGPYQKQLASLADLLDRLEKEHDVSFVKAGDDKVYAFGGSGFIVVLDESRWEGLIEFITPQGALTIKPGADGKIEVAGTNTDEKATKQILESGIAGLRSYYENRYWSTPKAS